MGDLTKRSYLVLKQTLLIDLICIIFQVTINISFGLFVGVREALGLRLKIRLKIWSKTRFRLHSNNAVGFSMV